MMRSEWWRWVFWRTATVLTVVSLAVSDCQCYYVVLWYTHCEVWSAPAISIIGFPAPSSVLSWHQAGLSVQTRDFRVKTKFRPIYHWVVLSSHGKPVKKCNIYRSQQPPPQSHPNMAAAQVAKKLKDRRQKQTLEEIFRKVCLVF